MITVAFDLGDGKRDLTPTQSADYGPTSGGAPDFLKYIKEEMVPFVDANYRTNDQRLFWSHSIGGLFGLYVLLTEPALFDAVLVSSPFMVYDRDDKFILKSTEQFLSDRKKEKSFLYICVGNEPGLITQIEAFLEILTKNKPEGLTWKYVQMPEESHRSILSRSLVEGLRTFAAE
jgi:predicted alpha/beta superfamily hydrolase